MTTIPVRRPLSQRDRSRAERKEGRFPHPLKSRRGLVCAGGGVMGAYYEMGALAAIEERIANGSLCDFDVFVGVSAGSYVGCLVASGVSPTRIRDLATAEAPTPGTGIDDLDLFRLNCREAAERALKAPFVLLNTIWDCYTSRSEISMTDLVHSLGEILPSGVFTTEGLGQWVEEWLSKEGRSNDFRKLEKKLRVVAVELDTGETRSFGSEGSDHVPISRAVQASCALPGLYSPVRIDGADYVDGGVTKTAHISLAIEDRCGLIICVNPIVPTRHTPTSKVIRLGYGFNGAMASAGLPAILDQVFRVILHSRMRYGMDRYRREAPDSDILVFEPRPEDLPRYMYNIMRTSSRARIADFAYRSTMQSIDADFERVARLFYRHGLELTPPKKKPGAYALEARDVEPPKETTPAKLAASLEILEKRLEETGQILRFKARTT